MISQTWYEPPNGTAPAIGDKLWTMVGHVTITEILEFDGTRYLVRTEREDPQPVCC